MSSHGVDGVGVIGLEDTVPVTAEGHEAHGDSRARDSIVVQSA
jgi:hypothetical protein